MSNNPPVIVELTSEQVKFLEDNCDNNMVFALNALQEGDLSEETCRKLVDLTEQFRGIKTALALAKQPMR